MICRTSDEAYEASTAFAAAAPPLTEVKRRVRDSNPGGRVNALVVFKTTAIGH